MLIKLLNAYYSWLILVAYQLISNIIWIFYIFNDMIILMYKNDR